jgi:hypothetical protein
VQSFLDQAGALATTTAQHSSNLEVAIRRLPGLLAAAEPSLRQLDVVARNGTPLVQQLGAAAPYLNQASIDLGPFVAAAKPGLAKLSTALTKAIPSIKHTTPLTKTIRSYTTASLQKTKLSGKLFTSLQQAGFGENFLGIQYYVAAALARFDGTSHLLGFALDNVNDGACINYATTPVAGCSANFGGGAASAVSRAHAAGPHARLPLTAGSSTRATAPSAGTPSPGQQSAQTGPQSAAAQQAPASAPTQSQNGNVLQNLVNFLLG